MRTGLEMKKKLKVNGQTTYILLKFKYIGVIYLQSLMPLKYWSFLPHQSKLKLYIHLTSCSRWYNATLKNRWFWASRQMFLHSGRFTWLHFLHMASVLHTLSGPFGLAVLLILMKIKKQLTTFYGNCWDASAMKRHFLIIYVHDCDIDTMYNQMTGSRCKNVTESFHLHSKEGFKAQVLDYIYTNSLPL